jgi:hypothetical protein
LVEDKPSAEKKRKRKEVILLKISVCIRVIRGKDLVLLPKNINSPYYVICPEFRKFVTTFLLKLITMSILNSGKNKKDKKKGNNLPGNKSMFITPKGGSKANTKGGNNAGKHVGGAQRGA